MDMEELIREYIMYNMVGNGILFIISMLVLVLWYISIKKNK